MHRAKMISTNHQMPKKSKKSIKGISERGYETVSSKDVAPWERDLEKKARRRYRLHDTLSHPWSHTLRVVRIVKTIAKTICPQHINAAITAAYLHDIAREDDASGKEHAVAGAQIAHRFFPKGLTMLERRTVKFAIEHHADRVAPNGGYPVTSNYPDIKRAGLIVEVIAALWDADRLDLVRMKPVSKRYLSTDYARKILSKTRSN